MGNNKAGDSFKNRRSATGKHAIQLGWNHLIWITCAIRIPFIFKNTQIQAEYEQQIGIRNNGHKPVAKTATLIFVIQKEQNYLLAGLRSIWFISPRRWWWLETTLLYGFRCWAILWNVYLWIISWCCCCFQESYCLHLI